MTNSLINVSKTLPLGFKKVSENFSTGKVRKKMIRF